MSQSETSARRSLPAWAIPILIFVGLAAVLTLSNQKVLGVNGAMLATSSADYDQFSKEALELSQEPLANFDLGEAPTDEDRKHLQSALERYEAMTNYNPTAFEPDFVSAKINLALDRVSTADIRIQQAILNGEEALRRAIAANDPKLIEGIKLTLADAHYVSSQINFRLDRYQAAFDDAFKATKAVPASPAYWTALASASLQLKKLPQAKVAVENALRLDSTFKPAKQLKQLIGP